MSATDQGVSGHAVAMALLEVLFDKHILSAQDAQDILRRAHKDVIQNQAADIEILLLMSGKYFTPKRR